jgi:hypothetical protein
MAIYIVDSNEFERDLIRARTGEGRPVPFRVA